MATFGLVALASCCMMAASWSEKHPQCWLGGLFPWYLAFLLIPTIFDRASAWNHVLFLTTFRHLPASFFSLLHLESSSGQRLHVISSNVTISLRKLTETARDLDELHEVIWASSPLPFLLLIVFFSSHTNRCTTLSSLDTWTNTIKGRLVHMSYVQECHPGPRLLGIREYALNNRPLTQEDAHWRLIQEKPPNGV